MFLYEREVVIMRMKFLLKSALLSVFLLGIAVPASAAVYDVPVVAAGDRVDYRSWWYGGNYSWSDVSANPNLVSHSYEPGNGNVANTALSFDLASLSAVSDTDIISVSLNYNILDIWTQGRDDVANLDGVGPVLFSGGRGWKSFNVTDGFKTILAGSATTADYYFSYTGFSGFTFSSAEGGESAFLRISTITSAVPEPETYGMLLVGLGLMGLVTRRRKK